jgi:predicted amidohydrolase YtcJ
VANMRIVNIGTIVSGDIDAPLAEGDTVVVRDGTIAYVGDAAEAPATVAGETTTFTR